MGCLGVGGVPPGHGLIRVEIRRPHSILDHLKVNGSQARSLQIDGGSLGLAVHVVV
jgi:hypothetical protein